MSDATNINLMPFVEGMKAAAQLREELQRQFGSTPSKLTDREKNARVDALLWHGWDETRCRICGWPLSPTMEQGCVVGSCSMRPAPARRADAAPDYEANDVAMRELEDELAQRGLKYTYLNRLAEICADGCLWLDDKTGQEYDDPEVDTPPAALHGDSVWALVRATRAHRRDAALKALGVDL